MARRSGGGGNVVTVVFLIFFILLSLGLGVATYLGFSQDDSKDKELKKTKGEFSEMEKERDWYKFQATLYRAYMGHTANVDFVELANNREKFDRKGLGEKSKDRDEVQTLVATVLDKKLVWDPVGKRPKMNYEELLDKETKQREAAEATAKKLQDTLDLKNKEVVDRDDQLKQLKTDHEVAYDGLQKRAAADQAKNFKTIEDLKGELKTKSDQLDAKRLADEEDKIRLAKTQDEKDKTIANLRRVLRQKEFALEEINKERGRELPADIRTDWKVVRIDSRGETVYINLGSADKVQPNLTFRVHGVGADGRPIPKDKALIEVTSVLGEHLSQAKINYVTTPRDKPRHDPVRDPVVQGDVIYNPSWSPTQKKHIAIAGVVDLTGSGRDDTEQFVRALERQNVIVDAYVDLRKDFTIKGPGLTVQTDFLVLGEVPNDVLGVGAGPASEIKEKIRSAMKEIESQAKANGVRVRSLKQYLDEIGFRVPGATENKTPVLDLKGESGSQPPQVPKEPMPKEPMPKEPMKKDDKPQPQPEADK